MEGEREGGRERGRNGVEGREERKDEEREGWKEDREGGGRGEPVVAKKSAKVENISK